MLIAYLLAGAAFFWMTAIVTAAVSGIAPALGLGADAGDLASLFAFGPVVLYRVLSRYEHRFTATLRGE